jgi:hypothetical protein
MSKETQQTAVEQFSNKAYELFEQYSEGKFDRITLNKLMFEATEQAKAMNKDELKSAYEDGEQNQYDKIAIENRLDINSEEWFNLKYGGNK